MIIEETGNMWIVYIVAFFLVCGIVDYIQR